MNIGPMKPLMKSTFDQFKELASRFISPEFDVQVKKRIFGTSCIGNNWFVSCNIKTGQGYVSNKKDPMP